MSEPVDIDLASEKDVENGSPQGRPLDDHDRLGFAKDILLACALLFFISAILYVLPCVNTQASQKIFETFTTVLPPIVTLVLGYFFSKR